LCYHVYGEIKIRPIITTGFSQARSCHTRR